MHYCNDFDISACMDCLIDTHKDHEFVKIIDVYNDNLCEKKHFLDSLKSSIYSIQNVEDELQKLLSDRKKEYKDLKNNIRQRDKEIKEAVTRYSDELLTQTKTEWNTTRAMIKTKLLATTNIRHEGEETREKMEKLLMSHQALNIFPKKDTINPNIPEAPIEQIEIDKSTKFIPGNILKCQISKMFGGLYKVPDSTQARIHTTKNEHETSILLINTNKAFIVSISGDKFQKVKIEDDVKVEEDYEIPVYEMATLKNKEILVSSGDSHLRICSSDWKLKTFKNFSPLYVISVHVTEGNQIIVGLTDSIPASPVSTDDSVRKIVILNQNSDIQHTYEYDLNDQKLFTWPIKIIAFTDNICVIDVLNEDMTGRVLVFDYRGQIQWAYTGGDNSNFCPSNMVKIDNMILVSDSLNDTVHVLSLAGDVL